MTEPHNQSKTPHILDHTQCVNTISCSQTIWYYTHNIIHRMTRMKILIVGNGGREHALAWKVAQSAKVQQVYVAPGNAGTAHEVKTQNIAIEANDISALLTFAQREAIDLTIVGPEGPLAAGIVDAFTKANLACFGPSQQAAQLESSKTFCKDFLRRHHIPTAEYASFTEIAPALAYLQTRALPIVIKADGLAAGKGVVIAEDFDTAELTINNMLADNTFGSAGHRVVIEDFLRGEEASFIVMSDGEHILALASSQDHKALLDGDLGPNTGGIGAYSPAPIVDQRLHDRIMDEIINPTVRGMAADGIPYTGFLYAGVMVNANGDPYVLEFNCRLGDPETQPLMMRLQSDLVELCLKAIDHQLDQVSATWDPRPALGVVLAAKGYPGDYTVGTVLTTLPTSESRDKKCFHAGTRIDQEKIVISGGRVLCVTALGDTISAAQQNAYALCNQIAWPDAIYRKDIGHRAVKRGL